MTQLNTNKTSTPDRESVCGQTTAHLAPLAGSVMLHQLVVEPLQHLCALAREQGIELAVASGYRSFERQLLIWNGKASGQRPVFDSQGRPIDMNALSDRDKVFAILCWSALPGASRHHWGTDMDVWDRAAVGDDYRLELVPGEYAPGGPFAQLGAWLDSPEFAASGFYRPYFQPNRRDDGVAPEPWHLSYRPVAQQFEQCLSRALLASVIAGSELALRDTVLEHLDEIFARFVLCSG